MTELAGRILGYRRFSDEPQIRTLVEKSKDFDSSEESTDSAQSLIIFQTSKQQTWLMSSTKRLYCILDDVRRPRPRVQWSLPKNKVKVRARPKTEKTGLVDFDQRRRSWLFSAPLFEEKPIEDSIKALLK